MSDVFSGVNVLMSIGLGMFFLYSKSVEKQFEALKEMVKLDREESKSDDASVKAELKDEINRRVGQTTDIHNRVGGVEAGNCESRVRIARLEGINEERNR